MKGRAQAFRMSNFLIAFSILVADCSPPKNHVEESRTELQGNRENSKFSPTDLKYRLRDEFNDKILFCGPSVGVMSVNPAERFKQFPEIVRNKEEFQAILRHKNMPAAGPWSERDKQIVVREHRILSAITLEPVGERHTFRLRIPKRETTILTTEESIVPGRPRLPTNTFLIEGSKVPNFFLAFYV